MRLALLIAAGLLAVPVLAEAGVCKAWSPGLTLGQLDTSVIDEASGIEASTRFPGRLYHHNDSGDSLRFFQTDMTGGHMKVVKVAGPMPRDLEDMSLGPCGTETCLFLGDIGDNGGMRTEVSFILVVEQARFPSSVPIRKVIRARFPDGPHNAEAFAVHPNGDLILITKSINARRTTPSPANVYRLKTRTTSLAIQTFEKIGEMDLARLLPDETPASRLITGLDISSNGQTAILLTYGTAIELGFDLSKGVPASLEPGKTVSIVPGQPLNQQEAIAWLPGDRGFIYDSEAGKPDRGAPAPIRQVNCLSR